MSHRKITVANNIVILHILRLIFLMTSLCLESYSRRRHGQICGQRQRGPVVLLKIQAIKRSRIIPRQPLVSSFALSFTCRIQCLPWHRPMSIYVYRHWARILYEPYKINLLFIYKVQRLRSKMKTFK